ncbi:MAG: hypothetical protein AAF213_04085 [Pseudomonadota bacterium]
MAGYHQHHKQGLRNRPVALARDHQAERQAAFKQTAWWLGAGFAIAALTIALSPVANAQGMLPGTSFNDEIETYACSPNSQALLSQVELMKVAGSQLRQRWADQGFAVGQHMPDTGAHVFAGAQQTALANPYGQNAAGAAYGGGHGHGYGGGQSAGGYGAASFGHGGHGAMPARATGGYGSLYTADDTSNSQKAAHNSGGGNSGAPNLAPAPTLTLPASMTGAAPAAHQTAPSHHAAPAQHAAPAHQPPVIQQATAYSTAIPGVDGGNHGLTPEVHNGLLAGDPAAVRSGLNTMMNSVDSINPSYERFFEAHPSMKEHLAMAQEMGVGPGAIQIDPATVARQFGIEYDGNDMDPYSYIPPATGSALSRLALRFRSLFYSH